MASIKNKDLILEAIETLRKRKSRPDLCRITYLLQRKHGLSYEDIILDFERLIEENIVLKVEFKGSISYRIADVPLKDSTDNKQEYNMNKIHQAFLKISENSQNNKEIQNSVDIAYLQKWLLANDEYMDKNAINSSVQEMLNEGKLKEVKKGRFVLLDNINGQNGNVVETQMEVLNESKLKSTKDKNQNKGKSVSGQKQKKPQTQQGQSSQKAEKQASPNEDSPNKKGRPLAKRKRIKKTHGPDFETYFVPTPTKVQKRRDSGEKKEEKASTDSRKSSPTQSETENVCDFCLKGEESNRKGSCESLLYCKDCEAKAHPSCMDYSEELGRRAAVSPWQCIDCKVCYVCEDSGDTVRNDSMLFCDACDKGYHMDCHDPPIIEKPTGKWICTRCKLDDEAEVKPNATTARVTNGIDADSNQSTVLPTPTESPVNMPEFKPQIMMPTLPSHTNTNTSLLRILPSFKNYVDKEVPDASVWNTQQVVDYFTEAGFGEHAQVFVDQEIDGKSLLLLKRSDVLQGLSLKVGPALKIYAHIQRLQTKGQFIL